MKLKILTYNMKHLNKYENNENNENNYNIYDYIKVLKKKCEENYITFELTATNSTMSKNVVEFIAHTTPYNYSVDEISERYKKIYDFFKKYNIIIYQLKNYGVDEFYFICKYNEILEKEVSFNKFKL